MKPLILLLLLAQTVDPVTESRKLQGEALDAYRAKNAALFLEKARAAAALRPKHPTLQYQLAIAQAMSGATDDALAILERIAEMGFVYNPQKQPELAAIASSPRFAAITERFASNAKPAGAPKDVFTLDEQGIIGEGLAFDAKRERFFVSGVHARKIFAIDRDGHASTFASNLDRGAFGMAVDAKRGVLWVATSSLPQVDGFREADRDTAALVKLDLRSGRVLATLRPNDKEKHLFGDVTLAADGEVFVSDGSSPIVFHVEGGRLTPFARGAFASLQGLAATSRYLYVSDYSNGLYAIDRKSREITPLDTPDTVSLLGVDGIYLADDRTLIAVQNGANPIRVLRLALRGDGIGIDRVTTLAANHASMTDVTLGTLAHGAFHFIANGGWEAWTDDGKRNEKVPLESVRVMRVEP
ncbi:MAG: hypothetical protein DMF56_21215 [Acidobacteria bacterium]|nr:MAG: hypothetical protein DMF56_21215 [Acidobacteriota bacterium]